LNFSQKQQSKVFIVFQIKSIFLLIPMPFLNGFEEDIETNYNSILGSMPTSCNVDNNTMPNITQNLVHRIETKADGGTPPIAFKKKLNEKVEVFPRPIFTSKSKKR
jgi:hypothetical protein